MRHVCLLVRDELQHLSYSRPPEEWETTRVSRDIQSAVEIEAQV